MSQFDKLFQVCKLSKWDYMASSQWSMFIISGNIPILYIINTTVNAEDVTSTYLREMIVNTQFQIFRTMILIIYNIL